jgi:hypothetical protein
MSVRIQYFTDLLTKLPDCYRENNMHMLYARLRADLAAREGRWQHLVSVQKVQLMRSRRTLEAKKELIAESLREFSAQDRNRQIMEFIDKEIFQLCLTSPASRKGLLGL